VGGERSKGVEMWGGVGRVIAGVGKKERERRGAENGRGGGEG